MMMLRKHTGWASGDALQAGVARLWPQKPEDRGILRVASSHKKNLPVLSRLKRHQRPEPPLEAQ